MMGGSASAPGGVYQWSVPPQEEAKSGEPAHRASTRCAKAGHNDLSSPPRMCARCCDELPLTTLAAAPDNPRFGLPALRCRGGKDAGVLLLSAVARRLRLGALPHRLPHHPRQGLRLLLRADECGLLLRRSRAASPRQGSRYLPCLALPCLALPCLALPCLLLALPAACLTC